MESTRGNTDTLPPDRFSLRASRMSKVAISLALLSLGCSAIAWAIVVASGRQEHDPEGVLRARRVEIIDSRGDVVIEISAGSMRMMSDGADAVLIGSSRRRGFLTLNGESGAAAVQLTSIDAQGVISTLGPEGQRLVMISSTTKAEGTITTFGSSGKGIVDIAATTEGSGMIVTADEEGHRLVTLSKSGESGAILTSNSKSDSVVSIASSDGAGLVEVFNKSGEPVATMAVKANGDGEIGAWDRYGIGRVLQPIHRSSTQPE